MGFAKLFSKIGNAGLLAFSGYEVGQDKEVKIVLPEPRPENKIEKDETANYLCIILLIIIMIIIIVAVTYIITRACRKNNKAEEVPLRSL